MAANNIFSDQDFEKTPNEKKNRKRPLFYGGIVAALIAAGAIGYSTLGNGGGTGSGDPKGGLDPDTTVTTPKADTLVSDTLEKINQVVTEPGPETSSAPKPPRPTQGAQTATMHVEEVKKAAISVIRGNYGNNPERRRKLGDRYQEIQSKVNEMYRNGEVR